VTQKTGLNAVTTVADTVTAAQNPALVGSGWFPPAYTSTGYYYCNSPYIFGSSSAPNGDVRVGAWVVTAVLGVTRMFAELVTAGDAASVFRFGVWADDGYGRPGTLIYDVGTISTGSGNAGDVATGGTAGVYEKTTPGLTLQPGLYWVGGCAQAVTSVQPVMRLGNGAYVPTPPLAMTSLGAAMSNGVIVSGWKLASGTMTGALTTFPNMTPTAGIYRIGFRAA
jgi:hypothetical protein